MLVVYRKFAAFDHGLNAKHSSLEECKAHLHTAVERVGGGPGV